LTRRIVVGHADGEVSGLAAIHVIGRAGKSIAIAKIRVFADAEVGVDHAGADERGEPKLRNP